MSMESVDPSLLGTLAQIRGTSITPFSGGARVGTHAGRSAASVALAIAGEPTVAPGVGTAVCSVQPTSAIATATAAHACPAPPIEKRTATSKVSLAMQARVA